MRRGKIAQLEANFLLHWPEYETSFDGRSAWLVVKDYAAVPLGFTFKAKQAAPEGGICL